MPASATSVPMVATSPWNSGARAAARQIRETPATGSADQKVVELAGQFEVGPHGQGTQRQDHQRHGDRRRRLVGVMPGLGRHALCAVESQEIAAEGVEGRQKGREHADQKQNLEQRARARPWRGRPPGSRPCSKNRPRETRPPGPGSRTKTSNAWSASAAASRRSAACRSFAWRASRCRRPGTAAP